MPPFAISFGAGGEARAPLGVTVASGLLGATAAPVNRKYEVRLSMITMAGPRIGHDSGSLSQIKGDET